MLIVTDHNLLLAPSQDISILEYEEVFQKLESSIGILPAVGLAAIQIGIAKRAFIVKYRDQIYRFANTIIVSGKYPEWDSEGCLSIPGRNFNVERFQRVMVQDDINGVQEYRNMLARIVQHEHDHTMGVTLIQSGKEIL